MNTVPTKTIIEDILSAYHVRGVLLNRDSDDLPSLDFHMRDQLYDGYDYDSLFEEMSNRVSWESSVDFEDEFGLHYLLFQPKKDLPDICVVGPFQCTIPSDTQLASLVKQEIVSEKRLGNLKSYFMRIAVITDSRSFKYLLGRVLTHLTDHPMYFSPYSQRETVFFSTEEAALTPNSTLAYAAIEARYEAESKVLEAIQAGNVDDALYYHHIFMGFTFETRDEDALRSAKDYVIAANSIFRKAAEYAYVHPLYIDELNGRLTRDIESVTSLVQLDNLCTSMVRKYCLLVRSYSRKQYSSLVRNCLNYIDFHYKDPLSLTFFAEKYSVNRNYLSSLFHRETGTTLTGYINATRVRHAVILLNTTALPMQDISEQCGFTDANYFTRTFKKIQGMSPLKYRQSLLE